MRARLVVLAAVAGAAAMLAVLPAAASHDSLRGDRVTVFGPSPTFVSAAEPFFVRHGWVTLMSDWRTLAPDERREFLDESVWRFELFVNDVPVEMQRSIHNGTDATRDLGRGLEIFWAHQFEPGDLPPGQYTLTGRWYGDVDEDDISELELEQTRTLVVSPTVPE